jgi:YD repeat-containing protein
MPWRWDPAAGAWRQEFRGVDTTSSVSSCDGAGGCTTTVTAPDGSYTATVTQNGEAVSQTHYDGNAQTLSGTTMNYDPQGRLWNQVDLRDGTTTYTYDAGDELRSVNRSGQTTGYDYDGLGRKKLETEPDGGKGGGKADLARGAGKEPGKISDLLWRAGELLG